MVERNQVESREWGVSRESRESRKCSTPQNFCLAFIDELEKQLFTKKTVEVGQ